MMMMWIMFATLFMQGSARRQALERETVKENYNEVQVHREEHYNRTQYYVEAEQEHSSNQ